MADLRTPLLDQNQNQSDNVSDTPPPPPLSPRTSPPPSTTTSPNVSPLSRQNLGDSRSPNSSSPNGLFVSLQTCCPPSVLFNRRPGHARAIRFPAPPSQPTGHQSPSNGHEPGHLQVGPTNILQAPTLPDESAGHVQGIDKEAAGDVVDDSLLPLTNDHRQVIGEDSTGGSLPTSTELLTYRLGIVPIHGYKGAGYKVSIRSESDLKELWKLVLERREIQNFVKETIKTGREHSKILGFVGSLVVLFSTTIDAALAEDISKRMKVVIFIVFLVIFIVYMMVSNLQLDYIYDPALSDARIRYDNLLIKTNIARRRLLVPNSKPMVASSIRKEWELQQKFDEYCEEIGKPLPIRRDRCISFVELNSIAFALVMAFLIKGMSPKPNHP